MELVFENFKGIEYFLGGSHRFGYSNSESDLDYFIFLPNAFDDPESVLNYLTDKDTSLHVFLRALNMLDDEDLSYRKSRHLQYGVGTFFESIHIFGFKIDLTFFEGDYKAFEEALKEHDRVENYLNENPEIRNFVKNLRVGGKEKYRSILQQIQEAVNNV